MAPFHSAAQDLRLAVRVLLKSPGATALAVVSIALGIGLTAGVFSLGDAVFLRPMPFRQPDRVLMATSLGDDGRPVGYGWLDYLDMAAAGHDLAEFASSQRRGLMLAAGDETEMLLAVPVTPNYFSFLGVRALVGRASVDMVAARPGAVLGYRLWQRLFGGDRGIAGRTVLLNGQPFTVAGVMPKEFTGIDRGISTDVWVSNEAWFTFVGVGEQRNREGQLDIMARLRPGVTPRRVAAQLDAAIRGPGKHKPAPAGATGTVLERKFAPDWKTATIFGGGLVLGLWLVLLVAGANVAQLRLAQAESRRKELGVRLALGAGKWRLVRQLLTESALISLPAACGGLILAGLLMERVALFATHVSPFLDLGLRLDYRVLAFSAFSLVLCTVISGLAPARHAVKVDIAGILKSDQGGTDRAGGRRRKFLMAGQIAVSVALFGMAAMFLYSLSTAAAVRPGLDPHKKLFTILVSPGAPAGHSAEAAWAEEACRRLAVVAGARGCAFARRLPLSDSGGGMTVRLEIPGQAPMGVHLNDIGPGYFELAGTRVLAGRGIDTGDRAGSALVAVVNQTLARQVFAGKNPVGEWLRIEGKMRQVVGVAEDGPSNDLHENREPFLWLPYSQAPWGGEVTLMVETAGPPGQMARALRAELKRYDPRAAILVAQTLEEQMSSALAPDRLMAVLASGLALFAVLLTAAGLFGVLQYAVNRRTRELGLRIALGARPEAIRRMLLVESLRIAAWGIPFGLALLLAAGWAIRSWLLGVTPLSPLLYLSGAAAALLLALAAAWLPAARATRMDPAAALRGE